MENDDLNTAESRPPGRSIWLRVGIGLALVLSVLLIGAGYLIGAGLGGDDDGGPQAGAPEAGGPAKPGAGAAQYVACMREKGLANFPDPGPDGRVRINPQDGIDIQSEAFKSAEAACASLLPEGAVPQGQPGPIPAGSAPASFVPLQIDTRAYVACMRENGVPDFPDPVNGMFRYDARTDAARAADKICRKHLPSDAPPPPQ